MASHKKNISWINIVLSYTDRDSKKIILESIVLASLSVISGIVPFYIAAKIVMLIIDSKLDMNTLIFCFVITIISSLCKAGFFSLALTKSHIVAYSILEKIRHNIADKLMKVPLGYVVNETTGKLKSIIIDRVENIELPLAHIIPEMFANILLPLLVFIYLATINIYMAFCATLTLGLYMFVIIFLKSKSYDEKYDKYMQANEHVNSVINEYTQGIEVIKTFGQTTNSFDKYRNAVIDFKNLTLDWFKDARKYMSFSLSVLPALLVTLVPFGVFLYQQGNLTPSDFAVCLILSIGLVAPLSRTSVLLNMFKEIDFSVKIVNELLSLEELENANEQVEISSRNIAFNNVTFSYEHHQKTVINDISFEIKEGAFVALVGPSGGGKSTVAKLIARFWDVSKGGIKIGDHDIKDIPLQQLLTEISFVSQDNFLFNTTIRENIRLGKLSANDEEIEKAAKLAECSDFIEKLPDSYDSIAGESGDNLSGGEKQRLTIARAILKDSPIIILDEATAFTDPENEYKIQNAISRLAKGKTLLVIAHRLSTIKNADAIILLNDGKIESEGTHEQLLAQSPLYHKMWTAHVGAKDWSASTAERNHV